MSGPPPRAPDQLGRYLLDSERLVVAVRRHPASLVEPVVSTAAGLVVVYGLDGWVTGGVPVLGQLVWLAWVALVLRAVVRLAQWRRDWFVATDRRLLLTHGLLTHKVAMMPLTKVTDLSYHRSPLGRLLGYGQFVLESAGQEQALRTVGWLPEPDTLYRRVCAELFGPEAVPGAPAARPSAVVERVTGPVRPLGTDPLDGAEPPDGTERPPRRWLRRG